jgi:hypothetical protein
MERSENKVRGVECRKCKNWVSYARQCVFIEMDGSHGIWVSAEPKFGGCKAYTKNRHWWFDKAGRIVLYLYTIWCLLFLAYLVLRK